MISDFDDFYATPGLMTVFDFKNYFDCIPLDKRDWKFTAVTTPLGKREMKHLTYGWKNAAPIGQAIMNKLMTKAKHMIGYIDDVTIKHPIDWGTRRLTGHLDTVLTEVGIIGGIIHTGKFVPYATAIKSVGFVRTMIGSLPTPKYIRKCITIPQPQDSPKLRSAIGLMLYISRYVRYYAMFAFWLIKLAIQFEGKARIVWTSEGNYAWKALMYLIENIEMLFTPNKTGIFCVKTDASMYATGGALYQLQRNESGSELCRLIDLHSKIIPINLQYAHCQIHESLAVTWMCQH